VTRVAFVVWSALAAVLGACSPAAGNDDVAVGASSEAIVNGSDDSADPAVVTFVDPYGSTFCSGVLVAPDRVVTAAHCFAAQEPMAVRFGADSTQSSASVSVRSYEIHPQYDAAMLANDVAIATLAAPAPVDPIALGDAPAVGAMLRVVGWGRSTPDAGDGHKRDGAVSVTSLDATTFHTAPAPAQPCANDSGGAAIVESANGVQLVGVVSAGDRACAEYAVFSRADAFRDFILAGESGDTKGSAPSGCSAGGSKTSSFSLSFLVFSIAVAAFARRRESALSNS
jgi:secreted trypsin-like serine protease